MKTIYQVTALVLITTTCFTACTKEHTNKVPVADAGPSQTIQLPVDAVTVTGKGSDADGKVVGYLWSEISGPNTATIVYPGAASTGIKGLVEGTYVFQFMVTDDMGATGLDTMSIKVNPPS